MHIPYYFSHKIAKGNHSVSESSQCALISPIPENSESPFPSRAFFLPFPLKLVAQTYNYICIIDLFLVTGLKLWST